MQITIYGAGYVGLIGAVALASKAHDVLLYDIDTLKIKQLRAGITPIYEENLEQMLQETIASGRLTFTQDAQMAVDYSPLQMICVGTPSRSDGTANLSYIKDVVHSIVQHNHKAEKKLLIEKSTVPVGTHKQIYQWIEDLEAPIERYEVASNPEFLREGKALDDFLHPDRIVCGVASDWAEDLFRQLYASFQADGYPLLFTNVASAELIKQASNSFLAMKISYANMLAEVCELVDASVVDVTKGMGLDRRIGKEFLQAGIGFGGSCFPKDVSAFIRTGEELGLNLGLLRETLMVNARQRDRLVQKILFAMGDLHNKRIAIWGLAFKPDTDDVRETPAIYLVRELLGRQATVHLYDPIAIPNFQKIVKESATVHYCSSALEAIQLVDAVVLLTPWQEFLTIDYKNISQIVQGKHFFDARNSLDQEEMKQFGFHYVGMG
ncbi:UDP-glucose/GDP-mannose dehydrogenase family protein (plasmid) [Entomospira entomophila]|uniref:UDP-glucose 6-dehydrogenase n=1 Tax=Entomospira entomophila TaxID=2719988 RepID=A0A968KS53_9SPIO|nr:UDP-glucose/GDP-mannose dehydrogenase family protein [Entomospira entomophilus]NIZ41384.1 UDP-glucose/GDP-mannose dehydrogenase family protein [Entomospira entomophilus]WDI36334.1 UDP-glucose/GDP-mannose dehydrogenase family protein [Entomospira entomophilus]